MGFLIWLLFIWFLRVMMDCNDIEYCTVMAGYCLKKVALVYCIGFVVVVYGGYLGRKNLEINTFKPTCLFLFSKSP